MLLLFLTSCRQNKDLDKITSTERYFSGRKPFDMTSTENKLAMSFENNDAMCGRYNFIVWSGFDGHELLLNQDSTFKEKHWTDYTLDEKYIKGKWNLKSDTVVLNYKKHKYYFIQFQYSWAVFLIPVNKVKLFNSEFQKNKYVLDNISGVVHNLPSTVLQDTLSFFTELCFIKFPIKNKP